MRVNGIAPGIILLGDNETLDPQTLTNTPLKRIGTPEDIAHAVLYLIQHANYTTGQTLNLDGGRGLNI